MVKNTFIDRPGIFADSVKETNFVVQYAGRRQKDHDADVSLLRVSR